MKNNRVAWIDYMSGIGTLMVFMQHACVPLITRIILGFHMPLFFWISGFLYQQNNSYNKPFGKYIKSRTIRLLVPYLLWFVIDKGQAFLMKGMDQPLVFAKEVLKSFLYCYSWFLPCLFLSEMVFHIINKKMVRLEGNGRSIALGGCAILFWILSWIENVVNPNRAVFCLDTCLMALGFMFFGSVSVQIMKVLKEYNSRVVAFEMVGVAGVGVFCIMLNGKNNANFMMYQNQYGNYVFAIIGASSLIFALYFAVNLFERYLPKRYLQYLRENGILLFLVHIPIITMVKELIPVINTMSAWTSSIICLVAIHIIGFPTCYVINKWFPLLAGKQRSSHRKEGSMFFSINK